QGAIRTLNQEEIGNRTICDLPGENCTAFVVGIHASEKLRAQLWSRRWIPHKRLHVILELLHIIPTVTFGIAVRINAHAAEVFQLPPVRYSDALTVNP